MTLPIPFIPDDNRPARYVDRKAIQVHRSGLARRAAKAEDEAELAAYKMDLLGRATRSGMKDAWLNIRAAEAIGERSIAAGMAAAELAELTNHSYGEILTEAHRAMR